MNKEKQKRQRIFRRKKRSRVKIKGTKDIPRLCVFRSNKHISAQLIDDEINKTIVSFNDLKLKGSKTEKAGEVGDKIAKEALSKKITKIIFDKGQYRYHGRVKSLADGARKGGLKF